MINYDDIEKYNLYGTLKFCIKEFPEDFKNTNILLTCNMADTHKDFQLIYDLIDININQSITQISKKNIQKYILNSTNLSRHFIKNTPYLFNNMTMERYIQLFNYFKNEPYYLRLLAKKVFNIKIDLQAITDIYLKLPTQSLRKYFLKHNQYNDFIENTYAIIAHLFRDYEALEDYLRICKPTIEWNKLINSISEETFYRITSIINTMRHYPSVKSSYNTMKKSAEITTPDGYSKHIQEYLENHMKNNSMMSQLMCDPNPPVYNDRGYLHHDRRAPISVYTNTYGSIIPQTLTSNIRTEI